jgi:hypothetical protein
MVNSSNPDIRRRKSESTRSTTRSNLVCVRRWLEWGPPGSNDEADCANWMCIDPMRAVASLGQNLGAVNDATPSIERSCTIIQLIN